MQRRAFHAVKQRRRDRRFCDGFPVHRYPVRPTPQSAVLLYNYIPDRDDRQHFPDAHNVLPAARLLLGYDPEELVNIYTRQDEVMNMIDEGLAATDLDGRILFANQKASTILGRPANEPPLTHLTIQELFPQTAFDQIIKPAKV